MDNDPKTVGEFDQLRRDTTVSIKVGRFAGRRPRQELPAEWNEIYVLDRLSEAFDVLARDRSMIRPRGFANSMPSYTYEQSDLIAQVETHELERMAASRNRVMPGAPAPAEITRMEEAISWLAMIADDAAGSRRELRQAVGLAAVFQARRAEPRQIRNACKARGFSTRTFHRRKLQGLKIIAIALIRRKVPVS